MVMERCSRLVSFSISLGCIARAVLGRSQQLLEQAAISRNPLLLATVVDSSVARPEASLPKGLYNPQ